MLFQNCRELPIHNFNEICITNDLTFLVKEDSKDYKDEDLLEKWISIVDEYNKLQNNTSSYDDRLKQEKNKLKLSQMYALLILDYLEKDKQIVRKLCSKINVVYEKLDLFINQTIKELRKEEQFNENSNENQLEETLAILNENGFKIDRFKTPVSEYIACINRLKESIKAKSKLNK